MNADGRADLLCAFDKRAAGFKLADTTGYLLGSTIDAQPISGADTIHITK